MGATFYQVGVLVPDIERAMEELTSALGVRWEPVADRELGSWQFKRVFTLDGPPHIELIEGEPGSPWDPSAGARMDHIGYWTPDILRDKRRLEASGLPIDVDGAELGGHFSYHRAESAGMRVELVDLVRQPEFLGRMGTAPEQYDTV